MRRPILYLLVGYPGAGKTTISRMIANLTDAAHIWADRERKIKFDNPQHSTEESKKLYNELNEHARKLLSRGVDVIFDTNFNYRRDRDRLRKIASSQNANTKLIWIKTNKGVARKRATEGGMREPTRIFDDMSHETFDRLSGQLEPPTEDENPIIIQGEGVTEEYLKNKLGLS